MNDCSEHPEITRFILLATQRSGSTFIRLWLNDHPNIRCHGEVFLRHYQAPDGFRSYCESTLLGDMAIRLKWTFLRRFLTNKFLRSLYYNPSHSAPWTDMSRWNEYKPRQDIERERAIGFKLMYDQFDRYPWLLDWIKAENVRVLHLIRVNTLRIILSKLTAEKRKTYHSTSGVSQVKVHVDTETVVSSITEIERSRKRITRKFEGLPTYSLYYDKLNDYVANPDEILNYLGVPFCPMNPPSLKKLNTSSVEDMVVNFPELVSVLEGTPYERFLRN